MKIKINTDVFAGYAKDEVIVVDDHLGIPLDMFWRRRLLDSLIDNCCEVVSDEPELEFESEEVSK